MNKLTAIYSVMKQVQEMKQSKTKQPFNGEMQTVLTFGESDIFTASGQCVCEDDQCRRQAEMKFGTETMKFERAGSSEEGCCSSHSGMHKMHFHKHAFKSENGRPVHSMRGHKFNKLSHAMLMIKLLDLTKYEALENGQNQLSLEVTLADLPRSMRVEFEKHLDFKKKMLKSMLANCEGGQCNDSDKDNSCCETECCQPNCCEPNCCEDECCEAECCEPNCCESGCCDCSCGQSAIKWAKQSGLFEVDLDSVMPEKIGLKLIIDSEGKPQALDVQAVVQARTLNGEDKPLRFTMKGKML